MNGKESAGAEWFRLGHPLATDEREPSNWLMESVRSTRSIAMPQGKPDPPCEDDEVDGEPSAIEIATATISNEIRSAVATIDQQARDLGFKDAELEEAAKVKAMLERRLVEADNTIAFYGREVAKLHEQIGGLEKAHRAAQKGWEEEWAGLVNEVRVLRERVEEMTKP